MRRKIERLTGRISKLIIAGVYTSTTVFSFILHGNTEPPYTPVDF